MLYSNNNTLTKTLYIYSLYVYTLLVYTIKGFKSYTLQHPKWLQNYHQKLMYCFSDLLATNYMINI